MLEVFKRKGQNGKTDVTSKVTKSATSGISRAKLGNLLEDFKTDLLSTLGTQVETSKTKKRQEQQDQQDQALSIFCPICRKKHPLKECPLNTVEICGLCTSNHKTDDCPRLKELQAARVEENQSMESLHFMGQRRPWQP